jgi:hypothetical protein
MRADELLVISRAEYEALKKQAEAGRVAGQRFDVEEMQAIREQYQELVEAERVRREELEWKLRVELARVRTAELSARRNADDLRQLEESLLSVFDEGAEPQVRASAPGPQVPAVPKLPPVSVAVAITPVPPPIPAAAAPAAAPGSHADKFRQAMAHRKRYSA